MTSFKSTVLVGAALASIMLCYSVSLRASGERASVAAARTRIAHDLADMRLLRAELRTRSRLPELQRWNEQVLALAPPRAEQLLASPVMLATYAAPKATPGAPVEVAAVVRDAPPPPPATVERVVYVPRAKAPAPRDLSADAVLVGTVTANTVSGFQKIALR